MPHSAPRMRLRISDRLLWLYISFDVWLFHKAPQISNYLRTTIDQPR